MRQVLMIAAALSLLSAPLASAQTIDKSGHCRDAPSATLKGEICTEPGKTAVHKYRRDAEGQCRDEKGSPSAAHKCKA